MIYFPKSVLLLFLKKMRRLVKSALSFCMVIRRMQRCFLCLSSRILSYQAVRSAVKSSAYRCSVVSERIPASISLSVYEVPTAVLNLVSIIPFNPFCNFADEDIGTRRVTDSPTASCEEDIFYIELIEKQQ